MDEAVEPPVEEYVPATLEEIAEGAKTNLTTLKAAVQWHLSGADWATIAARFSFSSPQAARVAVERFEGEMVDSTDVAAARNKARARYEQLLRTQWPDAMKPYVLDDEGKPTSKRNEAHASAMLNARGLVGDMVRLDGLAAPSQLQLYMPGSEELMTVVSTLREVKMLGTAREPDIFDAEEVDDADEQQVS